MKEHTHKLNSYIKSIRFDDTTTDEDYKLWYSRIINKKASVRSVSTCTLVYGRILTRHMAARWPNITIIQVYEPTLEQDVDHFEEFYDERRESSRKAL